MNTDNAPVHEGLEGIVVTTTSIGMVDGDAGKLVVRGVAMEDLAPSNTYESAAALLWPAILPLGDAESRLGRARGRAWHRMANLGNASSLPNGMDALRASLAHLQPTGDATDAIEIAASACVAVAAWSRVNRGLSPVAPNPHASQAADFLRMMTDATPDAAFVRGLNTYWVTVCDHGMNASTFAARVVASTEADMVSAIVAAVGALKGPLHGGAPGPVLDMLDAIGTPANAEAWIDAALARGERIMGMGHRIYRVRDPRAEVLERAVETLAQSGVDTHRLALARAVETVARGALQKKYPARSLNANVEFYTAVLLDSIGLPRESFSPVFAIGRVLGWCAHVMEQRAKKRLIRPDSRYVPHPAG